VAPSSTNGLINRTVSRDGSKSFSAASVSYYYLVNGFADYLELADIDVVDRLLGKRFLGRGILCTAYIKKNIKKGGLLLS
jgi:hypothetical protein